MSKIAVKQALTSAQRGYKRDITQAFQDGADRVRGELRRTVGDGPVEGRRRMTVLVGVGRVIDRLFVGEDGRRAYADENGADPLSPVAEALTKWTVEVQARVVLSHARYAQRKLAGDSALVQWLQSRQSARLFELDIVPNPIFFPNPLARYEAAHTWVDPNGYRLSDRIWRAGQRTRDKIDRVVNEGIREGWSSTQIADAVEGYLLPGRQAVRTKRPYDLDASFDAMRLGRTEISRAHAEASRLAAAANPYVTGMDFALSAQHPRRDICDDYATIGMGGGRIREPYEKGAERLPVVDTHPQCLCFTLPYVSDSPREVTNQLRAEFRAAQADTEPPVTVVAARALLLDMFGRRLFQQWVDVG